MGVTHPPGTAGEQASAPRVREQARAALVLMGFSLVASVVCVAVLTVTHLLAPGSGR